MIIECKKMFIQELDYANLANLINQKIMEEAYKNETFQTSNVYLRNRQYLD